MGARYFQTLPNINYSNTVCKDISRRPKITNEAFNTASLFYPYEVKNSLRADVLAYTYYDDSYFDWLIYMVNGVVDPYYDWTLSEQDFEDFIVKKYGSLEIATQKIRHYQLNWADNDTSISTALYESLPEALKKYYSPNFGYNTKVISYRRRREDWVVNTNKVIQLSVTLTASPEVDFIVGERVNITSDGVVNVGGGEVITSNTSTIIIHHVHGNTSSSNYISGLTSNATGTVDQSIKLVEALTDDEAVFWDPVSYYDYEKDKNESKKFIRLIDANYSLEIYEELRKSMK